MALPQGVWPVMLTPFAEDGSVDYEALERLTEWYIASGSAGLFPVAQSGEMYELSPDERVQVAKKVQDTAAGRVPVVACGSVVSSSGFSAEASAAMIRKLAPHVAAVVLVPSAIVQPEEGEDVLKQRIQQLMESTEVDLGIYECPVPYHRLLSPELMEWIASQPRFVFMKDTSRQNDLITKKLAAVARNKNTNLRWYNGNVTTLLHSLQAGADGYSGVSGNFYPWMHVWLCKYWSSKEKDAEKVQRFLTVAENLVKTKYPHSAKMYLKTQYNAKLTARCRGSVPVQDFNEEELTKLTELRLMMTDVYCAHIDRDGPSEFGVPFD